MSLIAFLLFGLIVGVLARFIMPGAQPMSWLGTMLLGICGSLLGGIVGNMMFGGHWDRPVAAGWIGSIVGALVLLALLGRSRRRAFFG